MPAKKSPVPSEDRVRAVAHQLWLDAGQPEGQAEIHWNKAQEMVAKKPAKPAVKKAAPAKAAAPGKKKAVASAKK